MGGSPQCAAEAGRIGHLGGGPLKLCLGDGFLVVGPGGVQGLIPGVDRIEVGLGQRGLIVFRGLRLIDSSLFGRGRLGDRLGFVRINLGFLQFNAGVEAGLVGSLAIRVDGLVGRLLCLPGSLSGSKFRRNDRTVMLIAGGSQGVHLRIDGLVLGSRPGHLCRPGGILVGRGGVGYRYGLLICRLLQSLLILGLLLLALNRPGFVVLNPLNCIVHGGGVLYVVVFEGDRQQVVISLIDSHAVSLIGILVAAAGGDVGELRECAVGSLQSLADLESTGLDELLPVGGPEGVVIGDANYVRVVANGGF